MKPVAAFEWISCAGVSTAIVFAISVVAPIPIARATGFGVCTDDANVIAMGVSAIAMETAAIATRSDAIADEHL